MTGSSDEPSQNVILSEASQRDAESKDLRWRKFLIPNSEFRIYSSPMNGYEKCFGGTKFSLIVRCEVQRMRLR